MNDMSPVQAAAYRRHRITHAEFRTLWNEHLHKVIESAELLDGEIFEMPSDGPRTIDWHYAILRWAFASLDRHYVIIADKTLWMHENWAPKPDVWIFPAAMKTEDVRGGDVLLVIEVSDTTLDVDHGLKRRGYEEAGVRDYWVIDAEAKRVLVHRLGDDGAYGEPAAVEAGQSAEALLIAGLTLDLAQLERI